MHEPLSAIERIRADYPPLLTVAEYMQIRRCKSRDTVYQDIKKVPGLAVRPFGETGPLRLLRDVFLDRLAATISQPAGGEVVQ